MLVTMKPALLFSLLLASGADAASKKVRTARQLSQEKIGAFTPVTQVTDHAAIDLDQEEIEKHLANKEFSKASSVYAKGAHSKSFARLSLTSPLSVSVPKGTAVTGTGQDGRTVQGKLYADEAAGATTLRVQYATSDVQASYVGCQVGGSSEPVTDGCFAASGTLSVNGAEVGYTYDLTTANANGRTIQGFATNDDKHRRNGSGNYYADFQRFVDYYGAPDYADKWVTAAFSGTNSGLARGNADFSQTTEDGRVEAAKKGTAYLSIFMYVIRELEDAIDDCNNAQCDTREACNDDAVHALDEAVAFYSGSLLAAANGNGNLLYALAEKRCDNFATCSGGTAKVNAEIFQAFRVMQDMLLKKQCADAATLKDRIAELMYVPMVQGTLRYAYFSGEQNDSSAKSEAEGATFAAAVLPKVFACNADDAQTIYSNMKIGNNAPVDFVAVKKAFEKNYKCMGISCGDVGGLSNGKDYFDKASPCSGAASLGFVASVAFGVVSALALMF